MVGWKLKHSVLQAAFPVHPRSAAVTATNSGSVYSGCPCSLPCPSTGVEPPPNQSFRANEPHFISLIYWSSP